MSRLYLVRHGETEWNVSNRFQGQKDIPLSNKGKQQAEQLSKRLSYENIDCIYASDLSRAYETAKVIGLHKKLDIHICKSLREIHFGEWEGHTAEELKFKFKDTYINFHHAPHQSPFPGEGSYEQVLLRVKTGLTQIMNKEKNKNILIVSHSGVLKAMIVALLDLNLDFIRKFWLGNTSVSIVDIKESGGHVLTLLNDLQHLK